MPDLNDLNSPNVTDTEPTVLDTLKAHIKRAASWTWDHTANKIAGIITATTTPVSGGRNLRLYRRNDNNSADEEIVSLPGMSIGGNANSASSAQANSALANELANKAPLNSPALQGTPTTPTPDVADNSTRISSTAHVRAVVAALVSASPAALDTLAELATALGNDPNFATSVNNALANRVITPVNGNDGVRKLYRNDSGSPYNVQTHWTGTHWLLRGYNVDAYHAPCRVAYADSAGTVDNINNATGIDYTWHGRQIFHCGAVETFLSGDQGQIEVRSSGSTKAAFIAFHRPGAYAANFGLDTDNNFKVGGWSMGGPYTLWHAGNFAPSSKISNGDTNAVLAATAGGAANAVGTYALAFEINHFYLSQPAGRTVAGASLRPASLPHHTTARGTLSISGNEPSLPGTWRVMHSNGSNWESANECQVDGFISLWLRIA